MDTYGSGDDLALQVIALGSLLYAVCMHIQQIFAKTDSEDATTAHAAECRTCYYTCRDADGRPASRINIL